MEPSTKMAKKLHIILVSWQIVIAFDQWLISWVLKFTQKGAILRNDQPERPRRMNCQFVEREKAQRKKRKQTGECDGNNESLQ
jgi:hypothetical protein